MRPVWPMRSSGRWTRSWVVVIEADPAQFVTPRKKAYDRNDNASMEPKNTTPPRRDGYGRAFRGSQLQTQLWINVPARRRQLNEHVRDAIPELRSTEITWVSPLSASNYAEYQDAAFIRAIDPDATIES